MKKPLQINGLYLWSVQHSAITLGNLWITTERNDMEEAIKKSKKILKRHGRHIKITGAASHGTLDA